MRAFSVPCPRHIRWLVTAFCVIPSLDTPACCSSSLVRSARLPTVMWTFFALPSHAKDTLSPWSSIICHMADQAPMYRPASLSASSREPVKVWVKLTPVRVSSTTYRLVMPASATICATQSRASPDTVR